MSPSSRRSLVVHRTLAKIKKANEGPSPTSVTTGSFDFGDKPFDHIISTKKRASSVGNLKKINGMVPLQTLRTNLLPPGPPTKSLVNRSFCPPRSPRKASSTKVHLNPSPGSPGDRSVSKKASSYRQRRLQLAREKKWKDEVVERTVQPKSVYQEGNISIRGTIGGKEKIINSLDGVELSISTHLETKEFASSYIPGGQEQTREFPIQAARVDVNLQHHDAYDHSDHASCESVLNNEDDDAMTIDTISSLNTMHTERSTSGWSTPGLRSPVITPTKIKRKEVVRNKEPIENEITEDVLHPPMYVQSRVRRLKKGTTKEEQESHLGVISPVIDVGANAKITNITSSMNGRHRSSSVVEVLDVISNRKPRDEDDNDIPAISSSASNYDRASASSHLLVENSLQCDERSVVSVVSLRKKRLQQMHIARNRAKTESSMIPCPPTLTDKESSQPKSDHHKSDANIPREIKEVLIMKKPSAPPFDESKGQVDNHNDDAIDFELHVLADQREGGDDNSVVTAKSMQTMTTLKTCFTESSVTKIEMERMIKRKQNRVKLIHHALTCTYPYPEKVDDESYVPCAEVKHCHALGVLVRHVQTCTHCDLMNGSRCEVPGCAEYKKVWNHYRRCVLRTFTKSDKKKCKVCGDVWGKFAFSV